MSLLNYRDTLQAAIQTAALYKAELKEKYPTLFIKSDIQDGVKISDLLKLYSSDLLIKKMDKVTLTLGEKYSWYAPTTYEVTRSGLKLAGSGAVIMFKEFGGIDKDNDIFKVEERKHYKTIVLSSLIGHRNVNQNVLMNYIDFVKRYIKLCKEISTFWNTDDDESKRFISVGHTDFGPLLMSLATDGVLFKYGDEDDDSDNCVRAEELFDNIGSKHHLSIINSVLANLPKVEEQFAIWEKDKRHLFDEYNGLLKDVQAVTATKRFIKTLKEDAD